MCYACGLFDHISRLIKLLRLFYVGISKTSCLLPPIACFVIEVDGTEKDLLNPSGNLSRCIMKLQISDWKFITQRGEHNNVVIVKRELLLSDFNIRSMKFDFIITVLL